MNTAVGLNPAKNVHPFYVRKISCAIKEFDGSTTFCLKYIYGNTLFWCFPLFLRFGIC
jgi:hypothetical protein